MPTGNLAEWYPFLLGAALKSTAVLGVSWTIAVLTRRSSAATRHLVWTAAFVALVAVPLLSVSVPVLRVPVARALLPDGLTFQVNASPAAPDTHSAKAEKTVSSAALQTVPARVDWRLLLILLWAGGAALALAHMLLGRVAIARVRRQANTLPDSSLAALKQTLELRHEVEVLEGGRGSMPMTFGLFRPTVLMPSDSLEWSEERRRMVLLHELAHIRRADVATHLLARTALCFYWWNPLAWSAWREFLKERERAADDLVLRAGARASDYAGHLLEIARTMQMPRATAWAAVPMVRRSQLEARLSAILDSNVNRDLPRRTSAWIAAALAVAVIVPLAALRAQDNPEPAPADVQAAIAARNYDVAETLLESSLAIRAAKSGEQSVEYGLELLKLAAVKNRLRKTGQADELYTKAASVLGNRTEAATAFLHLGISAMAKRDFDGAIESFQRAGIVDPARNGSATMWMAVARQRQNRVEEADALFKEALAIATPNSTESATIMELYAQFLQTQNREGEAGSIRDQLKEARAAAAIQSVSRPPGSPQAYRIGGEITPPSLVSKVEPEYTEEARAALLQGTSILSVEIGADGVPCNIIVKQGPGLGLNEKAVESVTRWKFKPGLKEGAPVNVLATIEVNWRLM